MMTSNLMMKFSRQSWYRTALSVLLIMCMVTSMMIMTVDDSHASITGALAGLVMTEDIALKMGAFLVTAGVVLTSDNTVQLLNGWWNSMTDTVKTTVEAFTSGNVLGDIFSNVSSWLSSVLNTGNIFYSREFGETYVFPKYDLVENSSSHFLFKVSSGNATLVDFKEGSEFNVMGIPFKFFDQTTESIDSWGTVGTQLTDGTWKYIYDLNSSSYHLSSCSPLYRLWFYKGKDSVRDAIRFQSFSKGSFPGNWNSNDVYWAEPSGIVNMNIPDATWDFFNYLYTGTMTSELIGTATTLPEYLPDSSDEANALTSGTTVFVPTTFETLWESTPEQLKTGEFVDVPVVPDIPITGETSGTISGEGSGTGVFEGIGSWVMDIPVLGDILGALRGVWDSVKGIAGTVATIATSVAALASGEVPAELETRIKQFSGQIFDLLSWDELSQSMAALESFGSGYGEPPVISINLHNLLEPAQNIGRFDNGFNNTETTVIDFSILEDERFGFMGMTLIELIRMMAAISMIWYTAWYVWEKIVPDDVVR